ncbi:MAG: glycosyltransferase family 4 protein [Lachnospiraceae bacterium]|nr:glycosyltransferase family 4 protein [Lachnospiraceae bacterium]
MRRILYIANYYLEDVIEQRQSNAFVSQAGQNKGQYIIDVLRMGGNEVVVWSNAWTSSRSMKVYRGFQSKEDPNVYYADIIGFPMLNVWACRHSAKKFLRAQMRERGLDVIVFYNMRLENAPVALYAKKKYGLPIILQYEDGLTTDANIGSIKRMFYRRMERKVLPALDAAFLVNSKIRVPCPSVVIRGALRDKGVMQTEDMKKHEIPIVLFASTLDRQRGIYVLLESLKWTDAKFELYITGKGEAISEIEACRDERVKYLGYLDYDRYQKVLSDADICINAQLAYHEFGNFSFPSKIYEYLSERKLVVSSDVADAKESLGNVLFVYENDSPILLAEQMEAAIECWKDRRAFEIRQYAIEKVLKENSIDKVANRVNRMLESIGVN